jgi:hypothetical protein
MLNELELGGLQPWFKVQTSEVLAESHMTRTRTMFLFFALANGVGCQHMNRSQFPTHHGTSKVTFQVHGLMKAKSGAT